MLGDFSNEEDRVIRRGDNRIVNIRRRSRRVRSTSRRTLERLADRHHRSTSAYVHHDARLAALLSCFSEEDASADAESVLVVSLQVAQRRVVIIGFQSTYPDVSRYGYIQPSADDHGYEVP